jgi:hypothetical protein
MPPVSASPPRRGVAPARHWQQGPAVTHVGSSPAAGRLADANFARAIAVPEALLTLRDQLPPTQWASRDLALNRSVVVFAVAAWQGWLETYVSQQLITVNGTHNARQNDDIEYARLLEANRALVGLAEREIARFSTPSASEVCRLLSLLGDDPRPRWSSMDPAGPSGPSDVARRLDAWVNVRHAIAHGAAHLPAVEVLARTKAGHGSLTRRHAAQCMTFFRKLVHVTGHAGDE